MKSWKYKPAKSHKKSNQLNKYKMEEVGHISTVGTKRVQRNFNPTANPIIESLKQKYADLIDDLEAMKADEKDARCISIAQTELETSCMYAVKSIFA